LAYPTGVAGWIGRQAHARSVECDDQAEERGRLTSPHFRQEFAFMKGWCTAASGIGFEFIESLIHEDEIKGDVV